MKTPVGRILLMAWALLLASQSTIAQPGMDPEAYMDRTMEEVKEAVGLSEEQTEAIRPLLLAEFEQRRELFATARESGAGFQGVMEQMQALQTETDDKAAEHLTEDQVERWAAWREAVAQRRRQRMGGG